MNFADATSRLKAILKNGETDAPELGCVFYLVGDAIMSASREIDGTIDYDNATELDSSAWEPSLEEPMLAFISRVEGGAA
ncbi:MAG: hypothetical protein ING75_07570 [Rhodocyclaceae bacterium]|nr:hypothetical protein [Rhodocyclaceae bacterium]